jgi:fructokinase
MKPVFCFGEALIDFLPVTRAGDSQARAFQQHAGGAPANVAVAVAALGGKAEFVGMLATDMFADFLLDSLHRAKVGTVHVQRTGAAPTALAFVALDEHGERSFSFYRPPAADLLFDASALSMEAIAGASVLHACSNSLTEDAIAHTTLACMRSAREAGVLVSFDMNLRPLLWARDVDPAPRIWSALGLADVVKLSREELDFLAQSRGSEQAAMDEIFAGEAVLVLVTDGARPLRWHARGVPATHGSLATYPVQVIDSTAAGDAFSGGFLFSLATAGIDAPGLPALIEDGERFEAMLRLAAACGALATTRRGAFAAMPNHDEVEALMTSNGLEPPEMASP